MPSSILAGLNSLCPDPTSILPVRSCGARGLDLGRREILDRSAAEVQFDPANHLVGRDHVHAPGKILHDVYTELFGQIVGVAVSKRNGPGLPASAVVAAAQGADGMDELVVRVGFPMRRLAASGYHHAWPILRHPGRHFHRGGQVH